MNMKRMVQYGTKKITGAFILVLGILAVSMGPGKAAAAGLLIADGGFGGVLEIKAHDVRVTINNGVAVTHVTQVFLNVHIPVVKTV